MARVAGFVLVSCALGALATACSFILDVERAPVPTAAVEEGGVVEAGAADVEVPPVPVEDAGVEDAGATFCQRAGAVRLCDDFERADAGDAGGDSWSVELEPGGAVVLANEGASTFLRATVAASADRGRAVLYRTFTETPATRLRFAYAARFAQFPASALGTMSVVLGTPPNARAVVLFGGPTTFTLLEWNLADDGLFESPLAVPIPTGRFTSIEMRIAFDVNPPRIDVLVDGQTALSQASLSGLVAAPPTFALGVSYAKPTPAYEVDVDDVLADFE